MINSSRLFLRVNNLELNQTLVAFSYIFEKRKEKALHLVKNQSPLTMTKTICRRNDDYDANDYKPSHKRNSA